MALEPEHITAPLQEALDAAELGTWSWDLATNTITWDAKLESLFGLAPGAFDGTPATYRSMIHPEDLELVRAVVEDAVATRTGYLIEHRCLWPDGSVHWVHCRGGVVTDADGQVIRTTGCVGDVTARRAVDQDRERETEQARHEATSERVQREWTEVLLAVNEALLDARTRRDVMRNVTRTSVPALGDWCAMYVVPRPSSRAPEVEIVHVDPEVTRRVRELRRDVPFDPDATYGIAGVINSAKAQFFPDLTDEDLQQQVPASALPFMRTLHISSCIIVPIVKQDQVLGALQFLACDPARTYDQRDLEFAEAVAARVASALDNLRLIEHQRHIANTLQASLLPERLPAVPGFDVSVRYWAAGEGTVVGGDFYDLFTLTDSYAIVIGDVCGTGPQAAALTGLARHTIRAAARHGDTPAEVLRHLNDAVREATTDSFCTALYGTVHLDPEPVVHFATAGHPLPILVRAGGGSRSMGEPGTLLGIFPDIDVTEVRVDLQPDDVLVLYTDGCTDHLPPGALTPADFEQLVALAVAGAPTAHDMATAIGAVLADLVPIAERDDDIALLVLRRT